MLPYKNRLIEKKDFEALHRAGKFLSYGSLAVKFFPNGLTESRVGLAVGLKFSKKAIKRNKVKRQLREILRLNLAKIVPGFDTIILVRKMPQELSYLELEQTVLILFQRAGLLK